MDIDSLEIFSLLGDMNAKLGKAVTQMVIEMPSGDARDNTVAAIQAFVNSQDEYMRLVTVQLQELKKNMQK